MNTRGEPRTNYQHSAVVTTKSRHGRQPLLSRGNRTVVHLCSTKGRTYSLTTPHHSHTERKSYQIVMQSTCCSPDIIVHFLSSFTSLPLPLSSGSHSLLFNIHKNITETEGLWYSQGSLLVGNNNNSMRFHFLLYCRRGLMSPFCMDSNLNTYLHSISTCVVIENRSLRMHPERTKGPRWKLKNCRHCYCYSIIWLYGLSSILTMELLHGSCVLCCSTECYIMHAGNHP